MKRISKWRAEYKERARKAELENIKGDFKIAEKNGKIYLTHNDYAFAIMPKDATVAEIAAKLNEARKAALELEGI